MDKNDLKILSLLHENSRMSITEIAKHVDLSRPSISERVEKLLSEKIIKKFSVQIDQQKLNKNILCFIEVSNLKKPFDEVEQTILTSTNVIDLYGVTGRSNFVAKAAFTTVAEMTGFLETLMSYADVETKVILSELRYDKINFDLKK